MSDLSTGGDAGSEGIPAHTPGGSGELSAREAANSLTDWRNKLRAGVSSTAIDKATQPKEQPVSQPESAPVAPAADQSADEADANPDEGHGETPKAEAVQEPPIEPPVSWTTAEKERWQSIPRETQEYIAQRETEREKLLTQKSREAEEQLKGLTAREQAMEQQRLQMEAVTIEKAKALQKVLQRDFSDIQSIDDVKKMAEEDWGRYNKWQVLQQELAMENAQAQEAQRRQAEAAQTAFSKFAQEQDKKFVERVPEFADKEKASKLQNAAVKMLTSIGFSQDELARHWNGQDYISLRDAKMQEVFNMAAKYMEAQDAAKKAVTNKTLPPVQRPGVAQPGNSAEAEIRTLEKQSRKATGMEQLRIETRIQRLKREAAMRSS